MHIDPVEEQVASYLERIRAVAADIVNCIVVATAAINIVAGLDINLSEQEGRLSLRFRARHTERRKGCQPDQETGVTANAVVYHDHSFCRPIDGCGVIETRNGRKEADTWPRIGI